MPPSSSLTTSNISGPPRARRTRTRSKFNLRFNFVLNIFRRDRGGSSSAGSVGATDTTTTTTIFQDSTTATTVQKLKTETIIILTSGDERDDEDDFGRGRDGIFSPDELERRENIHIGEEKMAIATYPSMSLLNAVIPQENWDDDFEFHPSEGDNVNNAHDGRYDGRNERDALNAVEESMRVDLGHSTSATSGSLVPDSHRRSLAQQPPHPHPSVPTLDSSPQLENWDEDFADDHPAVQPTTPARRASRVGDVSPPTENWDDDFEADDPCPDLRANQLHLGSRTLVNGEPVAGPSRLSHLVNDPFIATRPRPVVDDEENWDDDHLQSQDLTLAAVTINSDSDSDRDQDDSDVESDFSNSEQEHYVDAVEDFGYYSRSDRRFEDEDKTLTRRHPHSHLPHSTAGPSAFQSHPLPPLPSSTSNHPLPPIPPQATGRSITPPKSPTLSEFSIPQTMVDSVYSSTPLLGMHSDRSRGGSSMGFHGSSMGLVHPHPHPHTPPSAKLSKGKKEKGEKGEKEQRTRRRLKKKSRKPDDTIIPIPVGGVNIGAVIAGEEDGEERDQLRGLTRVRSYSPPPPPTLASQGAPNLRAYHHHQYSSSRPLTPPLPPLPVPHDGAGDATAASRGSSSSLHLPDPQFVPPPLPSSSSSSQTPPPPHAQISNSTNQATTSNGSKSPLLTRIGSMKRWGRRARSSTGPEAVIAHESSSSAGPSHPASSTFPAAFTSTSTSPVLVPSPGTPELKRGKSRDRLRALIQGALGGDQFLSEDDKTPKPSRIQVANAKAQAYAQAGPMPSAPSQGNASGKSTKTKGRSRSGTTGSIHPDPSSSSTNLVNPSGLPSSGRLDKPIPFVVGDGGGVGARRPVSLQPQSRVGSNADAKTAFPRSVSATNVPPASTATAPDHPRESGEEQREEVNGKPEVSFAQTQEKDVVKDKEKEKEGRRGFMDGVRRISFVGRHRRGKSVGVGVDLTPSASTVAPTSTSAIPSTSRAGPGYAKEKGALPAVPSASSSAVALDLEPEQDERDVRSTSRLDHLPQPIVPQLEPPAEILPPKATSLQIPPQVLPSTTPTPTSTTATASTTTSLPTFPKPDTPSRISPIQAASLGRANGTLITSSSSQGPASAANGTTGANVGPRRSSLGDLKIPSRISRAQIGIKRDLGMVREFAGNIEQLKKLQTTYVMLLEEADPEPVHGSRSQSPPPVTTTVQYHMPRPPSRSTSASTSQSLPGSQSRAKSKIPNEDLRRISLQYSKWWEAAEVLINLGGATPDSPASSTMSPPSAPPPVNPRSTSAVSAPILESKEKEKEPVQLQPSASPTKSTVARSRAVTLASDSPNRPTASVSGTDTTRSEKPWSESVGKQDLSTRQLMILKEMLNSPDPGSGSIALRDLPLPEGSTTELASPMNVGVGTSTGGREGLGLSGNWLGSMISVNTQAEGEVDDRDGAKSPTKKRRKSRLNGLKDLLKTLKKTLGDVDLTDPSPLQSNPNGQKDYHIQPMELSGSSASVLSSLEPHSRPATQLSYHRPHSKQQQYAQHQPPPPPPSDLQARHPPAHQRHQRHRSRDESSSNTKIDHGVQSRHRSNTGPARRLHPNSPYIATDIPMPDSRPPPPKSPRRPSLASIFRLGNTTKNKPAPIPHKTKDEEMLTHWDHLDSTSDIEAAAQGLHGHSTIRGNGRSRPGSAAGNAAAHNQSRRRPPSRQKSSHQLRTGRPETPVALRSASASQTSFLESSPQTVSHTSHSQHGHSIYPVSEYANAAPAPSTRRVTDGYPNGSTYNGPPPAFSSVRSAPPASMSTPTLGDPRLLLTPENIEPLLGYAKRVNEELGKCVEEIKVLLVSPASSGAR